MEDAIKSSVEEEKTLVPPSLRGGGRVDRWLFEKGPIEKASSVLLITCFVWWLVVSCLVGWLVGLQSQRSAHSNLCCFGSAKL